MDTHCRSYARQCVHCLFLTSLVVMGMGFGTLFAYSRWECPQCKPAPPCPTPPMLPCTSFPEESPPTAVAGDVSHKTSSSCQYVSEIQGNDAVFHIPGASRQLEYISVSASGTDSRACSLFSRALNHSALCARTYLVGSGFGIREVRIEDSGQYLVTSAGSEGVASACFELIVLPTPSEPELTVTALSHASDSCMLRLVCTAEGQDAQLQLTGSFPTSSLRSTLHGRTLARSYLLINVKVPATERYRFRCTNTNENGAMSSAEVLIDGNCAAFEEELPYSEDSIRCACSRKTSLELLQCYQRWQTQRTAYMSMIAEERRYCEENIKNARKDPPVLASVAVIVSATLNVLAAVVLAWRSLCRALHSLLAAAMCRQAPPPYCAAEMPPYTTPPPPYCTVASVGTSAAPPSTASDSATGASAASVSSTVADGLPELASARTGAGTETIVHGSEHATLVALV
nr:MAG: MC002L [Molluscum contagiosum virus]